MYRSVRLAFSLVAALLGERRVSARQGWAGEKLALLSILLTIKQDHPTYYHSSLSHKN